MAQLKQVLEPFGEVNVYPSASGKTRVVATILMEPYREGAQTGIALDGSGSMAELYGADDGSRIVSSIFGGKKLTNHVSPVAQKICAYLARKLDADHGTTVIYWAVGPAGSEIEEVGDFSAEQAERHTFGPPEDFGTGTQLLPAVRYFVDRFEDAPFGFYVFITDGEIHDLDELKDYSEQLARSISNRRRNPVKFVLIGIGSNINESQMEELDDLETGDIDLWDHKLAAEMRQLQDIFAEVVDKNARVANNGRILDANGRLIKDYSDLGLPAYLEFEVPAGSDFFTLEVNGRTIQQPLRDGGRVATSASSFTSSSSPAVIPPPPPTPPAEEEEGASEWKDLPLEFGPSIGSTDSADVGIEQPGDTPDVGVSSPDGDAGSSDVGLDVGDNQDKPGVSFD